jgi:hypothetical protein
MINDLLKRISKSLEDKHIPYMLSGSVALNHYTIPRMTLDIDMVIELDEDKLKVFLSGFDQYYYLNPDAVIEETKRAGMFNVIDYKTGIKIDFIVRKNTDYRKLEFSRRKQIGIEDFKVWIVSPEDLILSKIIWIQQLKSEKQIEDIKNLLARKDIDLNYIMKWCQKLNLEIFDLM